MLPIDYASLVGSGLTVEKKFMMQDPDKMFAAYCAMRAEGIALGLNIALCGGYWEERLQIQIKEARRLILRSGTKRLGEPGDAVVAAVETIDDLEALEEINDRLLNVESWQELLSGADSL